MSDITPKFIAGTIMLATNQLVGWGGVYLGYYLAKKTGKKIYHALGVLLYTISWGMVILGLAWTGPAGKNFLDTHGWKWLPVIIISVIIVILLYKKWKK